jgi:hypothetical protein
LHFYYDGKVSRDKLLHAVRIYCHKSDLLRTEIDTHFFCLFKVVSNKNLEDLKSLLFMGTLSQFSIFSNPLSIGSGYLYNNTSLIFNWYLKYRDVMEALKYVNVEYLLRARGNIIF